jgi:hypothetical protein
MKTALAFVVALVLGALLAYFLMSEMRPPSPAPSPPTMRACPDALGPGPRKAVVLVMWNREDNCHLKTVPNRLETCVGDELVWETVFIQRCQRFKGDLEIALKNGTSGDLETEPFPGKATGRVPALPGHCAGQPHCSLQYKVTLKSDSGDLEEDPRIDIWP